MEFQILLETPQVLMQIFMDNADINFKKLYFLIKSIMLWFPPFLGKPYEEMQSYECATKLTVAD